MTPKPLKDRLMAIMRRNRLICSLIWLPSLALTVVFMILRENSKVVSENPFYTSVSYNEAYTFGLLFLIPFLFGFVFWIGCFFCRYDSFSVDGQVCTLYRGLSYNILYCGKDEVARCHGYVLEAMLPSRTRVTIAFSRGARHAHVSFSSGQKPIEFSLWG